MFEHKNRPTDLFKTIGPPFALGVLAGACFKGFIFCNITRPVNEDRSALIKFADSAFPIRHDAYLLSVDESELNTLKGKYFKPSEDKFIKAITSHFESEHPSLDVIAVLDRETTLTANSRFSDLRDDVNRLGYGQYILVVANR